MGEPRVEVGAPVVGERECRAVALELGERRLAGDQVAAHALDIGAGALDDPGPRRAVAAIAQHRLGELRVGGLGPLVGAADGALELVAQGRL